MSGTPRAIAPRMARATDLRVRAFVSSKASSPAPLPAKDYLCGLVVSTRAPPPPHRPNPSNLGPREHPRPWDAQAVRGIQSAIEGRSVPALLQEVERYADGRAV